MRSMGATVEERSFLDNFRPGLDHLLEVRDFLLRQNPAALNPGVLAEAITAYDVAKKEAIRNALSTGALLGGIVGGLYVLSKRSR